MGWYFACGLREIYFLLFEHSELEGKRFLMVAGCACMCCVCGTFFVAMYKWRHHVICVRALQGQSGLVQLCWVYKVPALV